MAGGSTSTDRAFIFTDLRLHHEMSQSFSINLELEQDHFYAPKPSPAPMVSANIFPFSSSDVGFSLLGTPVHDKRQADLGLALNLGRADDDHLRFSWVKIDKYYNQKNSIDDSYYRNFGETFSIKGVYRFSPQWTVDFDVEKDQPLAFVFDDLVSTFEYQGYNYDISLLYQTSSQMFYGCTLRTMKVDKALSQTSSWEEQSIDYQSLDIYRVGEVNPGYELTLGFRYDDLIEQYLDLLAHSANYEFRLKTQQIYSTLYHEYDVHQAWDMGLYIGWSERDKTFLSDNPASIGKSGIQAKLRTSWQYHSIDKSSIFLVSISFNLDDLVDDPGDGGGIYFQKYF